MAVKGRHSALSGSLARRYARALIGLAGPEQAIDAFGEDLAKLADAYRKSPNLPDLLSDRLIPLVNRRQVASELVDKMEMTPLIKNFFFVLVEKERAWLLPDVVREYGVLQDQLQGVVRVVVTSATAPDPGIYQALGKLLQKNLDKKIAIREEQDPAMIGGLSVRLGNCVYDGSVRRELEKIKEAMMQQSL